MPKDLQEIATLVGGMGSVVLVGWVVLSRLAARARAAQYPGVPYRRLYGAWVGQRPRKGNQSVVVGADAEHFYLSQGPLFLVFSTARHPWSSLRLEPNDGSGWATLVTGTGVRVRIPRQGWEWLKERAGHAWPREDDEGRRAGP